MSYRIYCKKGGWIAASGFWILERAENWIKNFNPNIYMDKTLTKEDFEIQEEKGF